MQNITVLIIIVEFFRTFCYIYLRYMIACYHCFWLIYVDDIFNEDNSHDFIVNLLNILKFFQYFIGVWSQGAQMPGFFNSEIKYFVFCKELIVYNQQYTFRYCLDTNKWYNFSYPLMHYYHLPLIPFYSSGFFIGEYL